MTENILFAVPQHKVKFYLRFFKWLFVSVILCAIAWIMPDYQWIFFTCGVLVFLCGYYEENKRFKNSILEITDKRALLRVKKGLFRSFEVGLHYEQIINCSYIKKNILHSLTNSGTLYIRASEKPEGQIIADFVPNVEKVARDINHLIILSPLERQQFMQERGGGQVQKNTESPEKVLQNIPGILGVKLLTNDLKKFIFLHEEDRNHGVFEALRKKYTYVVLHGDGFLLPDNSIVHKAERKVIFPPVPFHELSHVNAISGSPSIGVHQKLLELFPDATPRDATILVGVDE